MILDSGATWVPNSETFYSRAILRFFKSSYLTLLSSQKPWLKLLIIFKNFFDWLITYEQLPSPSWPLTYFNSNFCCFQEFFFQIIGIGLTVGNGIVVFHVHNFDKNHKYRKNSYVKSGNFHRHFSSFVNGRYGKQITGTIKGSFG